MQGDRHHGADGGACLAKCWQIRSAWHRKGKTRIWRNVSESLPHPGKTTPVLLSPCCHQCVLTYRHSSLSFILLKYSRKQVGRVGDTQRQGNQKQATVCVWNCVIVSLAQKGEGRSQGGVLPDVTVVPKQIIQI